MQRPILALKLDLIDTPERLRAVDEDYAALLADSMERLGQQQPITVLEGDRDGRHRLVAGAHRLAAARLLGWATIQAVVQSMTDAQAKLAEIEENLIRRELSELDRGAFLAEWSALHAAMRGTRRGGDARKTTSLSLCSPRFSEEAAERLKLSARSVERSIARSRRLNPNVRETVRQSWMADNASALDRLTRLSLAAQADVIRDLILPDGRLGPDLSGAIARATGRVAAPPEPFELFLKLWRRMQPDEQRRVADYVRTQITTVSGGADD